MHVCVTHRCSGLLWNGRSWPWRRAGKPAKISPCVKGVRVRKGRAESAELFKRSKLGIPNIIPQRLRDFVDDIKFIPGVAHLIGRKSGDRLSDTFRLENQRRLGNMSSRTWGQRYALAANSASSGGSRKDRISPSGTDTSRIRLVVKFAKKTSFSPPSYRRTVSCST